VGLVGTRVVMLIVVSTALLGACSPPPSARPRDGAPVGVGSRPAPKDEVRMSYPTSSPSTAAEGAPPPLKLLSQQSPDGTHPSKLGQSLIAT